MGNKYIPTDWPGPVTTCQTCGNPAPDRARTIKGRSDASAEGPRECTLCFVGRVLNETCSEAEARDLRAELGREIRKPTVPWHEGWNEYGTP